VQLRELLETTLIWGLYPLWLLAGAGDYLCHRRTDIEHTSGSHESWYHVLQFICLLLVFAIAVLIKPGIATYAAMIALVLGHSVLAFLDVAYTDGRRFISPLEQTVHGYMEVLPWVAVVLFGILHWPQIWSGGSSRSLALQDNLDGRHIALVASYIILAGAPVLEELIRTSRARGRRSHAGFATIK
jgi:hypothetical protein